MSHPPIAELLRIAGMPEPEKAGSELHTHLAECATCRELCDAMRPGAPRPALPRVPRTSYVDWEDLGEGGMGRAFRARDRRLDRVVAVKELRRPDDPELEASLQQRFAQEAQLAARLEHPSIVPIYEAGVFDDGQPFYAMQYVKGTRLDEEIARRSSLEERMQLLPVVIAAIDAVAYAHARGIVHRDLTPRNILVGCFGECYVIDWGLAKLVDDRAPEVAASSPAPVGLTVLGVGTPPYLAPEQALGAAPAPAMDVYALGATLYEVLGGRPPYGTGTASELRKQILEGPPKPIDEVAPEVPPALAAIVTKAMSRRTEDRFATAAALRDDLGRFQAGQLTVTYRHGFGDVVLHFVRKHRAAVRISLLALVALFAVGIVSAWRIVREKQHAEQSERRVREALRETRGALAGRMALDPVSRLDALAMAVDALGKDASAIRSLQNTLVEVASAGPSQRILKSLTAGGRFSPDGARFAIAEPSGIAVYEIATSRFLGRLTSPPSEVSFSPDGTMLLVWGRSKEVQVWRIGASADVIAEHGDLVSAAAFSPNGRSILTCGYDGVVQIVDARTRAVVMRAEASVRLVACRWLTDDVAVAGGTDGRVWMLYVAERRTDTWHAHDTEIVQLAASTDGATLVTSARDGRVIAWNTRDRMPEPRVLATLSSRGPVIAVSKLGALAIDDGAHTRLLALSDGHVVRELAGGHGASGDLTEPWAPFSADGHRIALAHPDGHITVHDTEAGALIATLEGHSVLPWRVELVPDGHLVGSVAHDASARLWDLGTATTAVAAGSSAITVLARRADRLLTTSDDGTVVVWNAVPSEIARAHIESEPTAAAIAPGGDVAVGTAGGHLYVFDAGARMRRELRGHRAAISAIAISSKDVVVSASLDGTVLRWDGDTPQVVETAGAPIAAIALAPDDHALVTSSGAVIDTTTGKPVGHLRVPDHATILAVCYSEDGSRIAAGLASGVTQLWTADTNTLVATLDGLPPEHDGCPFHGRVLVTNAIDGTLRLWDAAGRQRAYWNVDRAVLSVAVHPVEHFVVAAMVGGPVRRFDERDPSPLTLLAGRPRALTWLADGTVAAAMEDGTVHLVPATTDAAKRAACATLDHLGRDVAACD